MTSLSTLVPEHISHYVQANSLRESDVLRRLREETATIRLAHMQIAPEQGQFMALLATLIGARRALEIGVYTGYSALCIAEVLPDDGELVACDISEVFTSVARRYWEEAGVAHKIQLHLQPAIRTLEALLAAGEAGSFDFCFIDADKKGYEQYYEKALELIRPGGLILVDNVLWSGQVAAPREEDAIAQALIRFNGKLHQDPRIDYSLLPIADGLAIARKRG